MVYSLSERKQIKDGLWNAISDPQNSSLRDGSFDDVKIKLYTHATQTTNYLTKKQDINNDWMPQGARPSFTDYDAVNAYNTQLKLHKDALNALDTELNAIVEEFATGTVKPIIDLADTYYKMATASTLTVSEEQFLETTANNVVSNPFLEEIFKNNAAGDLQENSLANIYSALTTAVGQTPLVIPGTAVVGNTVQDIRNYLFLNPTERKQIKTALDSIKVDNIHSKVREKIDNSVKLKTEELNGINNTYTTALNTLSSYRAPQTGINQSLKSVFKKYGQDLLTDTHAGSETDEDYQALLKAYVVSDIENRRRSAAENAQYTLLNEINGIVTIFTNPNAKLQDKKTASNNAKKLSDEITSSKARATKAMKQDLKKWYRYVAMDSTMDNPFLHKGEFKWSMFGQNDSLVENHDPKTYAQAGLLYFYETFINSPQGQVTDVNALQKQIVEKHKKASSLWERGIFSIFGDKKNYNIGVGEALKLGLGYAVTKSHRDNIRTLIESQYTAVTSLAPNASLDTIRQTYNTASMLGNEINDDAAFWTEHTDLGYEELDNEVNKQSGFSYRVVDTLWDFARKHLSIGGVEPSKQHDVDVTAIAPKSHPHAQLLFGSAGAAITAYLAAKTLWNGALSGDIKEVIKELGLIAGFHFLTEGPAKAKPTA